MIRFRFRRHPSDGEVLALIDGELSGPHLSRVLAHVAACPRCESLRHDLEADSQLLKNIVPQFPASLLERGKRIFERSSLRCPIEQPTLQRLFGVNATKLSCLMIEDLLGRAATPS